MCLFSGYNDAAAVFESHNTQWLVDGGFVNPQVKWKKAAPTSLHNDFSSLPVGRRSSFLLFLNTVRIPSSEKFSQIAFLQHVCRECLQKQSFFFMLNLTRSNATVSSVSVVVFYVYCASGWLWIQVAVTFSQWPIPGMISLLSFWVILVLWRSNPRPATLSSKNAGNCKQTENTFVNKRLCHSETIFFSWFVANKHEEWSDEELCYCKPQTKEKELFRWLTPQEYLVYITQQNLFCLTRVV